MFKKVFAVFCALVFSAMLTGCGSDMGEDVSSDISSIMDPEPSSSASPNSTPISEEENTNNVSEVKISKEKSKEIALERAGVKENEISDYEIDLDNENGVLLYEISFDSNGKEYDYDINAQTGEITNSENELID